MNLQHIIGELTFLKLGGVKMRLPYLENIPSKKIPILEFRGYNHNPVISESEFYDMHNLTSSLYPVLSPRPPRGMVPEDNVTSIFAKNKLAWVIGDAFVYDKLFRGFVTEGKKQFVSMGAYILIFPDKKYFNTANNEFGSLEQHTVTGTTITIAPSTMSGTPADSSSSLYVKISGTGIGLGFRQYDGVVISNCKVEAVNGSKIIHNMGNDYIVVSAKGVTTTTQSTPMNIDRNVPSMDFITENGNRVWGCSSANHEVYASKLGDPFNWNSYEGISTDSYAATIGSDGDFTGAVSYGGYVLFFKEDCIHKVHGSKPSNFQIYETPARGIAKGSEKSVAVVNETLFYMSRNGVVAYGGGSPEPIYSVFGDVSYSNAVGGALDDKYYVSIKEGNNYHLFVYDTDKNMWHREDNLKVDDFAYLDGNLYYLSDGNIGTIKKTSEGESDMIPWYAEFSDFSANMNKKYVSRLLFRLDLDENSIFNISINYGDKWDKVATLTGLKKRSYNVPIPIRRCDTYKIKLSGIGKFKLYSMTKVVTEGSDL